MNERMREPFHTLMWKASIGYGDSWSKVDPEVLEKFAELIVEECADLVEDYKDENTFYRAGYQIKRHFGLE